MSSASPSDQGKETKGRKEEEEEKRNIYRLKRIDIHGAKNPCVTQNENGPCPLIAIVNILLLRGQINFGSGRENVSDEELIQRMADVMLTMVPSQLSADTQRNYDRLVEDVIPMLSSLVSGLDVNIRFTGINQFEYTPACSIFDLLDIPLYHGWLVDPEQHDLANALSDMTYNQAVERAIDGSPEAFLVRDFLESTASQLTCYGLFELNRLLKDGQLAVLFRNNHFHTLIKHEDNLFLLVTDQGFIDQPFIVWETLINVEGDSSFVDGHFRPFQSSSRQQQLEADELLALSIQHQDEDQLANTSHQSASRSATDGRMGTTTDGRVGTTADGRMATSTDGRVGTSTDGRMATTTERLSHLDLSGRKSKKNSRTMYPSTVHESDNYLWGTKDFIGRGSFGQVYRGQCKRTGTLVAIKVESEPENAGQHDGELQILRRLNNACPFIVHFLAVEQQKTDGKRVLVLELADSNLQKALDEPCNHFGLPLAHLCTLLHDIACSLLFLRDNHVFHRDLKPSNILIQEKNDGFIMFKLCDFGGARLVSRLEQPLQTIIGTVGYASPVVMEHLMAASGQGQGGVTKGYMGDEADLWSVGVLLYQASTGSLPFLPKSGLKDSQAMAQMLRSKPIRAIGGRPNGDRFDWHETLPSTAPYPLAFRRQMATLLQGLLEKSVSIRWPFSRFHEMCMEISSCRPFLLFDVASARIFHFYQFRSAQLREDFEEVCGSSIADRCFFMGNGLCELREEKKQREYLANLDRPFVVLFHPSEKTSRMALVQGSGVHLHDDGLDERERLRRQMAGARSLLERIEQIRDGLPRAMADIRHTLYHYRRRSVDHLQCLLAVNGQFVSWLTDAEQRRKAIQAESNLCEATLLTLEPLRLTKPELYNREFRGYKDSGQATKSELDQCSDQFEKTIIKVKGCLTLIDKVIDTLLNDKKTTNKANSTLRELDQVWVNMQRGRHEDLRIKKCDWLRVNSHWHTLLDDVNTAEERQQWIAGELHKLWTDAVSVSMRLLGTIVALDLAQSMVAAIHKKNKLAIERLSEIPMQTTNTQSSELIVTSLQMGMDEAMSYRQAVMGDCNGTREAFNL